MVRYRRNFVEGGTYFFTATLADRRSSVLIEHADALRAAFRSTRRTHPFKIDAVVVLPDHLHIVMTLPAGDADYPNRWRLIKRRFTAAVAKAGAFVGRHRNGEHALWQRRFWEHTIRNEEDFERHVDYIQTLVAVAGTKPKQIFDCAKWLQSVVSAEEKLLGNHRWRAVTQILQARLVAIAILLRNFSVSEEADILGRWERISFRIYGLGGADARTKVGEYTELAWSIANERLSVADIMERLSQLGKDYQIAEVIDECDPTNAYEGWTEELRYFFYRYDEHLARKAGHKLNENQWNKIWEVEPSKSVEHIKPQSSGVSYMHHLGNLMMLPPGVNSKLRDIDPAKKAETYKTCGLLSSIEVANLIEKDRWDKAAVDARASKLLAWAKTQWKD